MIPLFLQMGDLDMPELSHDNSCLESSSWIADTMDQDYKSDETNPEMISANLMDSDDTTGLMGQEHMDVMSDAESVIGDLPMNETSAYTVNDEVESQWKFFF